MLSTFWFICLPDLELKKLYNTNHNMSSKQREQDIKNGKLDI